MTNEARPSEVAMDLVDSIRAEGYTAASPRNDQIGFLLGRREAALSITSAIADAVRKEAEECAKALDALESLALESSGPAARDAASRYCHAAYVIRARHTTDSKEQPR